MKQGIFEIISNSPAADSTFELILKGDCGEILPGQFAEIRIPGHFLRRPFSVCDFDGDTFTVLYHISGEGTKTLAELKPEDELDAMTGLGNGFDIKKAGDTPLLVAGGTGLTPLYFLAKTLIDNGITPTVIAGFASKKDVFYTDKLENLGARVILMTADGSAGSRGLVTDAMKELDYTHIYSCGPMAMFRAINEIAKTSAQYSLEARMGCGFGACVGCTIQTVNGGKRVCKDGPVFGGEELIW